MTAARKLPIELASSFTATSARFHALPSPPVRDPMFLQWLPLSKRYCFIRGFAQVPVNGQEFFASRIEAVEAAKAEGLAVAKNDHVLGDLSRFPVRRIGGRKR